LLAAFLATLAFITIPRHAFIINDELSEKAVLSYAHEHGLQFGREIVFTYGPFGYLISRYFFPHAASLRMAVDVCFCGLVATGVCLFAWRMRIFWRSIFIGTFVLLASNIDPRADLLLYVGLTCWSLLCMVESGGYFLLAVTAFVLLAAFGILVKLNFLVPATLGAVLIAAGLAVRRRIFSALSVVLALVFSAWLGWMVAGQSAANFCSYLASFLPIASGYSQVVTLNAIPSLAIRGFLTLFLVLATLLLRWRWRLSWHDLLPYLWLLCLLFLVWKHGFVRADLFHMGFFFGLTPLLALAGEGLSSPDAGEIAAPAPVAGRCSRSALICARALSLACCVLVFLTLRSWFFAGLPAMFAQPFRNLCQNIPTLLSPGSYRHEMLQARENEFRRLDLPQEQLKVIDSSTVDVFGQDQLYAIHNRLNYHPRPVFQSYLAFNAPLKRLNHQFYLSSDAPQFVFFHLSPIDHKFPPLEDSTVLRDLIFDYDLVSSTPPCLLFALRTNAPPGITLLRQGAVQAGQPIDLKAFKGTNLWAEIEVTPRLVGKCRELLYKPTAVRLVAWFNPGDLHSNPLPGRAADAPGGREGNTKARWKAPPPMLSAGFLASPLLLDDRDVVNVLTGEKLRRPIAYSVELDTAAFWQDQIQYRIYSVR